MKELGFIGGAGLTSRQALHEHVRLIRYIQPIYYSAYVWEGHRGRRQQREYYRLVSVYAGRLRYVGVSYGNTTRLLGGTKGTKKLEISMRK